MQIFGVEKLSLVDFDGYLSTTVFTGACNFRCPFCHNSSLVLDYTALPTYPEEDFFDYLNKRKGVLEGVCVSGGEPTLNKDLPEFLEKIKKLNLKVKLDTNGTNPNVIKSLFSNGLVDYFAMDIKNDKENYSAIVGLKNFNTDKVEKSVEFFLTENVDYEFRTTLIKEFHTEKNILGIGGWIKGAKKYFLQKFINSETCISSNLTGIDENEAKKFVKLLKPFVTQVKLRGYGG